jgi:hypothetical protein
LGCLGDVGDRQWTTFAAGAFAASISACLVRCFGSPDLP